MPAGPAARLQNIDFGTFENINVEYLFSPEPVCRAPRLWLPSDPVGARPGTAGGRLRDIRAGGCPEDTPAGVRPKDTPAGHRWGYAALGS